MRTYAYGFSQAAGHCTAIFPLRPPSMQVVLSVRHVRFLPSFPPSLPINGLAPQLLPRENRLTFLPEAAQTDLLVASSFSSPVLIKYAQKLMKAPITYDLLSLHRITFLCIEHYIHTYEYMLLRCSDFWTRIGMH